MPRLILSILFVLVSLLIVFPIPVREAWYFAIAVGEFPWIAMILAIALLLWNIAIKHSRHRPLSILLNVATLLFLSIPMVEALVIEHNLDKQLEDAFGPIPQLKAPHREEPFSLAQMVTGIGASTVPFTTMQYAVHTGVPLSLNLYHSKLPGQHPCLLVVHGGSWKSGNNGELPEANSYFAKAGFQVASINYRLAPEFKSPAPLEDVAAAIQYLKSHSATLDIDTSAFVLLGRSAGGQIVLTAAYSLHDPAIRGVISIYGPTDMFWAYKHPDNALVMHSKKVLQDYFGGTPDQVPGAYEAGSPIRLVSTGSVPTLLVHGMNDAHVHYDEAILLKRRLDSFHVRNMLLNIPWATHGCDYTLNGPSGQLAIYAEERFLKAVTQ